MSRSGGCYCGAVRYTSEGDPMMRAQCHCRECRYLTGGSVNTFMAVPKAGFSYTQGAPKSFTRGDLDNPVTREFCGQCGTPLTTLAAALPDGILLKVGALDDASEFAPDVALFTCDRLDFQGIPEGVPAFETFPG